jgi:hypothetical protein
MIYLIVQMSVPVIRICYFARYSLLIVHLFCSLFDYLLCFMFINACFIVVRKEKEQF